MNKCVVCNKEFEALRPTKRTCSDTCRQKYHRTSSTVTKITPIVTSTVTKDTVTAPIVTEAVGEEKVLKFRKDEPMDKRIKRFRDMYPNSTWVPNWIANGFLSKEEAIKYALSSVQKNIGISNLGLGND